MLQAHFNGDASSAEFASNGRILLFSLRTASAEEGFLVNQPK